MTSSHVRKTKTGRQWAAHGRLIEAAAAAVRSGLRVPCLGPDRRLWTSDRPAERAKAAARCDGCPLIIDCRVAGLAEQVGVWGGTDRTPV